MKQSVSLITLGVADYAQAKAFYERLGWIPALEIEETAFFQGNGVVVVLWAREKLAEDSGIPDDGARWGGIALAHNVASREEGRRSDRAGASCRCSDHTRTRGDVLRRLRGRLPRSRRPRVGGRPQSRLRTRAGRRTAA